jgi:exo-beta-1,3-glucanase (GH17 family)
VKEAVPGILVGYVDAYYTFVNYPELIEACDVILANCYPFWEHCKIDYALEYMKKMVDFLRPVSKGKPIIVSETGWPTKGD